MNARIRWLLPVLLSGLAGACSPVDAVQSVHFGLPGTSKTHAVITLEAGTVSPGAAWRIRSVARVGDHSGSTQLPEGTPRAALDFPVRYAVIAEGLEGTLVVEVDALDASGNALGRARGQVALTPRAGVSLTLVLSQTCTLDPDCDDGTWCNGVDRCDRGMCTRADPCPPSAFACVSQVECVEADRACRYTVDHAVCAQDGGAAFSCNPTAGCVPCGDGVVNPYGEQCDDGNDNANDGCHACHRTAWTAEVLVGAGQHESRADRLLLAVPEDMVFDRAGNLYVADWGPGRVWRLEAATGRVTRAAGTGVSGFNGDGVQATSAQLAGIFALTLDDRGNLYIADTENNRIRRVDRSGLITTVAGIGTAGLDPDGIPATASRLNAPQGVAVSEAGEVYIADTNNHRVCRVELNGLLTTVAGTGTAGFNNDDQPAISAQLDSPVDVALFGAEVFIADTENDRVRKVDAAGFIRAVAGNGTSGFDFNDRLATTVKLTAPSGLCVEADGSLLIAEGTGNRVRRVEAGSQFIRAVAGDGNPGYTEDGILAVAAQLNFPRWVTTDELGNIYVSEELNQTIRRIDHVDGKIGTMMGLSGPVYAGYGTSALTAWMQGPNDVAVGPDGSLYVPEYEGHRIRRILPDGGITTAVGTGEAGYESDGVPATEAPIQIPDGTLVDPQGNIIFSDSGNHCIRKVAPSGIISTLAGRCGVAGAPASGVPATQALFNYPAGIGQDAAGNIYVSDSQNHVVRKITPAGTITTVAGDPAFDDYVGDDGPAVDAHIPHVYGLRVSPEGRVYMADDEAHVVRMIDLDGTMRRLAGDGSQEPGFAGDNGPATSAKLNGPGGVLVDAQGNLFIADTFNHRVRKVSPVLPDGGPSSGIITTYAGTGVAGIGGDLGPATAGTFNRPYYMSFAADGALLISDYSNGLVRRIDVDGTLTTLGGTLHLGDGPFVTSELFGPAALAALEPARLWVADGRSGRVRQVDLAGQLMETVVGHPRHETPALEGVTEARLTRLFKDASGAAWDGAGRILYVSEREGHTIRAVELGDLADPATWRARTYAGQVGTPGAVDGTLAAARFRAPTALAWDGVARVLYVAEAGNHDVRAIRVDAPDEGTCVTTLVNARHARGFRGEGPTVTDGGGEVPYPALDAALDSPEGLALGLDGSLYIGDTGNHRVRRVNLADGSIRTVIGDGIPAASGIGAPARFFPVDSPRGLAVDAQGNLFITSAYAIRVVSPQAPSNVVSGQDGETVGTIYGAAPRDAYPESVTRCLSDVDLAADGRVAWVLDACQGFLVRLQRAELP
ncbi:MAG: hypothetical protein HY904_20125 [Deltaproteobacteria bacterium]|nr:hypothetical protein [Deltaproteobacteria bacterium]